MKRVYLFKGVALVLAGILSLSSLQLDSMQVLAAQEIEYSGSDSGDISIDEKENNEKDDKASADKTVSEEISDSATGSDDAGKVDEQKLTSGATDGADRADDAASDNASEDLSDESVSETSEELVRDPEGNEGSEEDIAGGIINNATWRITHDGCLIVEGTGNVYSEIVYSDVNDSYYTNYPWEDYTYNIKSATVKLTEANRLDYFFCGCYYLQSVDLSELDTSLVTDVSYMFSSCWKLSEIDLSNLDFSHAEDMSGLFFDAKELTSINFGEFDTSNVKYMNNMFHGCQAIESLDLKCFETGKVINMEGMFDGCKSLASIDLSNFNTSSVTNMHMMFYGCGLTDLNLLSFDTSSVTDMSYMFYYCGLLEHVDLSSFDTSSVTKMNHMFCSCEGLKELDVTGFDTSNVTTMLEMFDRCESLTELDLSSFDTSKCESMKTMFADCRELKKLDLSGFDTSNVAEMTSMFLDCWELEELDVSSFDTTKVTSLDQMFRNCHELKVADIFSFTFGNALEDDSNIFDGCYKLTTMYLNKSAKKFGYGFIGDCDELTDIYYEGSEEEWAQIDLGSCYPMFDNITIHYNYKRENASGDDDEDMLRIVKLRCTGLEDSYIYDSGMRKFTIDSDNYGSNVKFDIKVAQSATWELYDSSECTEESIQSHNLTLKLGTNTYYVKVSYGEESRVYTFNLVRRKKPAGPQDDGKVYNVKSNAFRIHDGVDTSMEFQWSFKDFKDSAFKYNHRLAIAGLALCASANNSKDNNIQPIDEQLRLLGFDDDKVRHWNYEFNNFRTDHPGVSIASKTIKVDGEDKVLITVVIRGTTSVADIKTDLNAVVDGFRGAGEKAELYLRSYINQYYDGELDADNTIFFFTGHSLGAATAARLAQEINDIGDKYSTFVYTYASPNYDLSDNFYDNKDVDFNIHTIINVDDSVPNMVSTKERLTYHTVRQWNGIVLTKYFINKEWRYNRKTEGDDFNRISKMLTGLEYSYNKLMDDRSIWHYVLFADAYNGLNLADPNTSACISHAVETYMAFLLAHAPSSTVAPRTMKRLKIECPVDVAIYDAEGNFCGSVTGEDINYPEASDIIIETEGDKKYILMPYGDNYRVELTGTDTGTMKYTMVNTDITTGEIVEKRVFENVALTEGKTFTSAITEDEATDLFVTDAKGDPVKQVEPDGKEIDYSKYGEVDPGDVPEDGIIPDGIWAAGIKDMTYTGAALKQIFRVYDGNKRLTEKKDYTVSYKNNKNAYVIADPANITATDKKKAPQVILKMKGDYAGTQILYHSIEPIELDSDPAISAEGTVTVYNGKKQTPAPVITFEGKALKSGTDFTVDEYVAAAKDKTAFKGESDKDTTYDLTITGKGNYKGQIPVKLTIMGKTNADGKIKTVPMTKVAITAIAALPYKAGGYEFSDLKDKSGKAIKLTYNKKELTLGTDFEVLDITESDKIGTATVTFRGLGNDNAELGARFGGTKKVTFKVTGESIAKAKILVTMPEDLSYTGNRIEAVSAKLENVDESDYDVTYTNNVNPGKATILFTGKNNRTGTRKYTFTIGKRTVKDADISFAKGDTVRFTKSGAKPSVRVSYNGRALKEGVDYTLSYAYNKEVTTDKTKKKPKVTVTGKGNFAGSDSLGFTVTKGVLDGSAIRAAGVIENTKPGKYQAAITVVDSDGTALKAGTDYDKKIRYYSGETLLDNKSKPVSGDVIRAEVDLKGNYSNEDGSVRTISAAYVILPGGKDISKATMKLASRQYTGKAVTVTKMDDFAKDKKGIVQCYIGKDKTPLTLGTDFEVVSYTSNIKRGTAKVVFRGIGSYGGIKTVTFKIGQRSVADFWKGVLKIFG